jgi:hypothetical protein
MFLLDWLFSIPAAKPKYLQRAGGNGGGWTPVLRLGRAESVQASASNLPAGAGVPRQCRAAGYFTDILGGAPRGVPQNVIQKAIDAAAAASSSRRRRP